MKYNHEAFVDLAKAVRNMEEAEKKCEKGDPLIPQIRKTWTELRAFLDELNARQYPQVPKEEPKKEKSKVPMKIKLRAKP
jgi:hypothetical protein